ncbi:MAG: hypothetical protein E7011_04845, partial [Alphaproteobacteria bacterium]|nr:hypothetical protein [Alphaproteobacteria bacterium]
MRFWLFCIAMIMYQNIACAATCGAGNYYNTSKYRCTSCNEGYYCPGDDTEHPCPSGTYNNKTGTSSSDDCKFPAAGYIATDCKKWGWVPKSSYTLITFMSEGCTDYERCPEGAYCTTAGAFACPSGTYSSTTGATSSSVCKLVPDGYQTSGASFCSIDGHYSGSTVSFTRHCYPATGYTSCQPGLYCIGGVGYLCPAGTYSYRYSATSSSTCQDVSNGYYASSCLHPSEYHGCGEQRLCPSGYQNGTGATSQSACVGAFTKTGSQLACSQPSDSSSYTCGTCKPGTCTYYKNYAGTITQNCTPTNCTQPVASFTCNAGYYKSGSSCVLCDAGYYCPGDNSRTACTSGYPNSDAGSDAAADCYAVITRGCTQNDGDIPSGCASVTAWNACSCAGTTYRKYASGSTSGTTSNETCTKTVKTVTASSNYYVSGTTCPTCSSYSSTYTKSDGGNIGSGSCYVVRTNTGTETAPALPTGCAAQTVNSCTKPTCTYKDYAGQSGETCSPGTCNQTHKACTSASTNYYLASGVAKTCSSYSSSYPSSAGGNITSDSCYGSFSKSGSQLACSQPANSASYTCGSCTVGTCNYTKYASGTIKTDCTPTNCTKPVASVSCKANYYASGVTCPACPTSYPYSDAGTTSDSYCYASKTSTGSQLAC